MCKMKRAKSVSKLRTSLHGLYFLKWYYQWISNKRFFNFSWQSMFLFSFCIRWRCGFGQRHGVNEIKRNLIYKLLIGLSVRFCCGVVVERELGFSECIRFWKLQWKERWVSLRCKFLLLTWVWFERAPSGITCQFRFANVDIHYWVDCSCSPLYFAKHGTAQNENLADIALIFRYFAPVADPDQAFWGDSQIGGRPKGIHLFKYQNLSAKIVGYHTKLIRF